MTDNIKLSPYLPYIEGLALDPEATQSARSYAPLNLLDRPAPLQRLEEFVMSLAYFHKLYTQRTGVKLTASLSAALHVFSFAASGFFFFIDETYGPEDRHSDLRAAEEWKALGYGLMWARSERNKAGAPFTPEEKEVFSVGLLNPDLLPVWVKDTADRPEEAGRFGAWAAIVWLLELAPALHDGETEDHLSALLQAFADPNALSENSEEEDFLEPEEGEEGEDPPRYEKPDFRH